jgi:hypothetical protein
MSLIKRNLPKRKLAAFLRPVVIRVYVQAGNVIETHEHKGGFKMW